MSTYSTSRGTRGQHVSPKYESRPYRPSPARREAIHGRIVPMHPEPICGLQRLSNAVVIALFAVVAVLCAVRGWNW